MFHRLILHELAIWLAKPDRKPLIIRGSRQVGKTTVIHQFGEQFDQYIYLNLELQEDRRPFESYRNLEQLLQAIFFLKNSD